MASCDRAWTGSSRMVASSSSTTVPQDIQDAIRDRPTANTGMLKIATEPGVGSGTLERFRRELRVDPRVSGGAIVVGGADPSAQGRSPRERGSLPQAALIGQQIGSIPA